MYRSERDASGDLVGHDPHGGGYPRQCTALAMNLLAVMMANPLPQSNTGLAPIYYTRSIRRRGLASSTNKVSG